MNSCVQQDDQKDQVMEVAAFEQLYVFHMVYSEKLKFLTFFMRDSTYAFDLTLKHRETHGCVVSTVATDALVLKHQAISILSTD